MTAELRATGNGDVGDHITERKRAEDSLKLFRTLIDQSNDAIEVIDPETFRFLDCNESAHRILGYSREEFLTLSVFDIDPLFDRESIRRFDDEVRKSGFATLESVHRRKDGSTFPVEVNVKVVRLERDYRLAVVRDITARKRDEAALRLAEQKYRHIFENAGEGIFQSTAEGRLLTANPALARMLGYDSAEDLIVKRNDIERQHYVDPLRRQEFKRLVEANGFIRDFEYEAYKKDGSKLWISTNVRAVREKDGTFLYYEGTAQDINVRKRAEVRSAAFATLARKLSGALTQLDAGRIIAQTAGDLFAWDSCDLILYDADRDLSYHILSVDTIDGRQTDVTTSISDREPTARARRVIAHGPELRLREQPVQFDADTIPFGDKTRPSASIMTVPIRHAARVVGLLSVQSYKLHHYDGAGLADLEALADHCGEALNRIRAEKSLFESEERFRQLSKAAFEAIILHDQGTILEVNQSFTRMYGYEHGEVIGKSVLDLTLPEFREPLLQRVRSAGNSPYEGLALRKDGTIFRAEVAGKPIRYQGRVVRVAAIRDITEQKRNEQRQAAQYAVTRVLAESATLAEATRQLMQVICESLRLKMGEFWRVCESTNRLRCVETWQVPALDATSFIEASRQTELAPGVGLPGHVWQSGQPAWIPDVTTDPRFERAVIAAKVGLRGVVAFPILLGNHTLGVMLFFSSRILEVDEELLKITSAIGSQIGQFTERKRAEEALRESEERYRDLVENSREFICTHDLDGLILSANRAAMEVLGYEPKDYTGKKSFRDLLVPEVRDQFDDYLARIRRDGFASGLTVVQTSSGKRRIWEYYNTLRTEGVATPIVRGMAHDITDRREAEKALRVSEQKYRDIFSFAPVGICQTLRDGTLITANTALARMLGYDSVDELLQLKLDSDIYFVAGEREEVITTHENRGYAIDLELQWKRKDGSPFWVQLNAHTIKGHGGAREYFEGFVLDITGRKRSEESLRKQNEYLAALHETALGLINRLDLNELLEAIVTRACALVNIPSGYVYLVEPGATEMRVKVGVGVSRDFVGALISKGQGVAGRIWQTGQPLVVNDYRNWEHRLTNAGYDALRLVGAVPLISGSQVVGVLGVESTEDGQGLGEHQIEILNRFAQLASIALDNAQLHSAVQQELAERKRSEEEISNLRRELELTMNSMEEGIHRVDMHGNISFENPAAARMLGWEVAELLGKPAHLTMHHTKPDGTPYPKEDCPIYATIRDGVSRRGADEVFCRRDGTSFPVEYMTAPMRNDRDEIVATVVTFRDITDRKRKEEVLREREARLSAIYRAAPVGIGVDVNRVIQEVNDTLCRITGYSREELIGQNSRFLFMTQEDYDRVGREQCRVTAEHLPRSITARLRRKDGRIIDVLLSAVPLDAADLGQGITFTVQDITEPKQVEEALREAEQKYRELFENAKDAIYVHDLSGRYTSLNPAAEALSGYPRDEILGKHFTEFIAPEYLGPAQDSLCRKLKESGETSYEAEVITRDGRRVPVEINSRLIRRHGEVVGVQGAARDITERKRAQEAMRSYSRRLIEVQEAERQSIARELHDEIGQVLTAVRINLQSAQRSSGTEAYSLRIEDSIVVVDEALKRVRELSLQLRPSLLDDLGLTAALRWYIDRYALRTGFTVQVLSDFETVRLRRELETACFRITQEALTNIARYTQATRVLVELKGAEGMLTLVIKDDGPGFDVDALFRNASAGASLGLRGMQERALAVEGRFEINSEPGQGTEVRVTFPLTRKG